MNTILCLKVGTKFDANDVNNLFGMFERNLTDPFQFVCITDNEDGILDEIKCVPILHQNLEHWWHKISFFADPLYDIEGTILTCDLDMVITDNVDHFFAYKPGSFIMEQDYLPNNGYSSCIMRFEAGSQCQIWENFISDYYHISSTYWGDQKWIHEQGEDIETWPTEWVKSYKWECCDSSGNFSVPDECSVIKFHGVPSVKESLHHVGDYWYCEGL